MRALLEVVILPVADPDRSLHFYRDLAEFDRHKDGNGGWRGGFVAGLDHDRAGYASFADFSDPDGNGWVLQERGHGREGGNHR
jgi:catechol 2,3-dioxygenase-like lactoylglutathione lyase family enzyme